MTPKHLSTDRLLALYHEDFGDFEGLRHLLSCPECRRAFDDSRWARLLGRLPGLVAAGEHLSKDEIEAYYTHALPKHRIEQLEKHMRGCRECLARAGRMREVERRSAYRSPSPRAVSSTLSRFRPRPLRRLGTVVVRAIEKGVGLVFESDSMAGAPASPHPSSASRRARRIMRQEFAESDNESLESPVFLDAIRATDCLSEWRAAAPLTVPIDEITLMLFARTERGERNLHVQLVSEESGRPIRGVRLRLRYDVAEPPIEGGTDEKGRAKLPFPPDATELIVELDPAVSLRIRHEA
jgi:hypothetical protein